jgi:hypothetical protein
LTIIIVPYTFIAPSQTIELLSRLWRGRTGILPLLFWLISFAAMANAVAAFNLSQYLNKSLDTIDPSIGVAVQANPLVQAINKAMNSLKAVIVFRVLVL